MFILVLLYIRSDAVMLLFICATYSFLFVMFAYFNRVQFLMLLVFFAYYFDIISYY